MNYLQVCEGVKLPFICRHIWNELCDKKIVVIFLKVSIPISLKTHIKFYIFIHSPDCLTTGP
jgi:hypothetical protein